MPDIPNISNIHLFTIYAQHDFKKSRSAIDMQVEHTTYGIGKIKDVIEYSQGIYIEICFLNDNATVRKFPYGTFSDSQFFVNMELPFKRERLSKQIFSDAQRRVEQLQRIAERVRLEKEEQQKIDLIKKQRMEEEAHKLLAAEKEKKRRIEEVNLAREHHEKEKQNLLQGLRKEFEQNFLYAYNFYHDNCSKHISSSEYQSEKNNYVRYWLKNHLNSDPDSEQITAIGALEGHVQVVARAGSGKTATLVNRALFLQKHCNVAPHEMLLLAFNRKAADEMLNRLTSKLQDIVPHVMTFHAVIGSIRYITIRVDNQNKKGRSGTYAIKDLLSSDGYQWRKKAWRRTFSVKDFSIQSFFDSANWVSHASGIEVQFYDDLENIIAIYHVNDGQAYCVTDNFSVFTTSASINPHKSLLR